MTHTKQGSKSKTRSRLCVTYLPLAEVKRGAVTSLPLPFRARAQALESAAVASRIMDADRNCAVFHIQCFFNSVKETGDIPAQAKRKVIPRWHRSTSSHNVRYKEPVSFGKDSLMRHPPRSYPGNKANLHRPVRVGLIPPLGYCIRSPTSTLIICTESKVNWRMTDCADSTHHWTLNEWLRILSCV